MIPFTRQRTKAGVFILEGLNSLSTTYYFYYIFFFFDKQFGFGAVPNLVAASGIGLVYAISAVLGGRFAQRFGYFTALKLGFAMKCFAMIAGSAVNSLPAHIAVCLFSTIGMCFTWPTLEALVSENEPRHQLQKYLSLYNVIWAGGGALAFFTGGAVMDHLGMKGIFLIPAFIYALQFILAAYLRRHEHLIHAPNPALGNSENTSEESAHAELPAKTFLKLAWLANPFAYVSIQTLIPIMPTLAKKLDLSPTEAGIYGSIWFFARTGSFLLLGFWKDWHYRFKWLALSYAGMTAAFVVLLISSQLWIFLLAQVVYGAAVGLIYSSSLFYSMDVSETKGEHGGLHEAAIGAGNCVGPALGAAALAWMPFPQSGTIAVALLLAGGFAGLFKLRSSGRTQALQK